MKRFILLWLLASSAWAQTVTGVRAVVVSTPHESQAALDTAQNQRLTSIDAQLKAMNTMAKTLSSADSAKGVMLNKLSTDSYITLPGNLGTVLGLALKQQVRNTASSNLHEVWVGTPDGNQLLTLRGGKFSITVPAGGQVIAIPHGLGYTPKLYMVNILNQTAYTYTATETSTYIILTLTNQLTLGATFTGLWIGR